MKYLLPPPADVSLLHNGSPALVLDVLEPEKCRFLGCPPGMVTLTCRQPRATPSALVSRSFDGTDADLVRVYEALRDLPVSGILLADTVLAVLVRVNPQAPQLHRVAFRPFDSEDWTAYSGAERFPNGADPWIGSFECERGFLHGGETVTEVTLIGDPSGIRVQLCDENDEPWEWSLIHPCESPEEVIHLLQIAAYQFLQGGVPLGYIRTL